MRLGKTIMNLRKSAGLTQEQLALKLGVSTPAVSKWECDNSYPDITLLAPLARALHVNLDELLSFDVDLTEEQVKTEEDRIDQIFRSNGYEAGHEECQKLINTYPANEYLKLRVVSLYMKHMMFLDLSLRQKYHAECIQMLEEMLAEKDVKYEKDIRLLLSSYYLVEDRFDQAKEMLDSLPEPAYDKSTLYSSLFMRQKDYENAEKSYENDLYKKVNAVLLNLGGMIGVANAKQDYERAERLADIYCNITKTFELNSYVSSEAKLNIYLAQKDIEKSLNSLADLVDYLCNYEKLKTKSECFAQIEVPEAAAILLQPDTLEFLKKSLLEDETFAFLQKEEKFSQIVSQLERLIINRKEQE